MFLVRYFITAVKSVKIVQDKKERLGLRATERREVEPRKYSKRLVNGGLVLNMLSRQPF